MEKRKTRGVVGRGQRNQRRTFRVSKEIAQYPSVSWTADSLSYAASVYLVKEKLEREKEMREFGVARAKDGKNQYFNKHCLEMPNPDTSKMQS